MFKLPPIVVIGVPERQFGEPYAQVTSAVRVLTDDYGLRVIVDGSPNSIPSELLTTTRETVMTVEPMSREQLESIPEFKILIDALKAHKLDNIVWNVIGGSPSKYLKLKEALRRFLFQLPSETVSKEIVDKTEGYLYLILLDALNKCINKSSAKTEAIINVFREKKIAKLTSGELKALGLSLEYPNKVFREVKSLDDYIVEPATPAISLIITENIGNKEGIYKLIEKLSRESLNS
jgi:hypothetical protein